MDLYSQSEEVDTWEIRKPFLKRLRRREVEVDVEASTTWWMMEPGRND